MENILFILNFNNSFEGSFMRSIIALSEQLKNNDCQVVCMIPESASSGDWTASLTDAGAEIRTFREGILSIPGNAAKIKKAIKEFDIKIIHSHFCNYAQHLAVSLAMGIRKDIDYIVHVHSTPPRRNQFYEKLATFLTNATVYIAVNDSIHNILNINGKPSVAISNAVDFTRLELSDVTVVKEDYLAQGCDRTILMFGHDFHEKGVDFVIRTLMEYDKEHKFQLLVAVSENIDEATKAVKEICSDVPPWVKLLPARNDIATYFNLADVFVLANRTAGSPYTMIECAYMGVPIIYCDIPGQNDLCIPWSVKISQDNSDELYRAVCEITQEDENETYAMGIESKDFVVNNFSLGTWVYEMLDLYKNINRM